MFCQYQTTILQLYNSHTKYFTYESTNIIQYTKQAIQEVVCQQYTIMCTYSCQLVVGQNTEIMQDDNLQSQESEENRLISIMVLPPCIKQ